MSMTGRKYGILIASSQFPDEPRLEDLRCPENDVDGLNDILRSPDYGQFNETFVLKNKPHHEVLRIMNRVLQEAGKDDLVLIYYSGHGKLNLAGRLHLAMVDTQARYLDTTAIPVARIRELVDVSSSNKIVLILDCCFAGRGGVEFTGYKSGVEDQLQLASGGRGTYILTASTGIQVAQEKESDEYGVFTKHIIEGIRSGEADRDLDGLVSMEDLYRYVHAQVLSEGFQEPMKWDLNVRGELFIARSGKTSREERARRIREKLFDLARQRLISDHLLTTALQILALAPSEQTEIQHACDLLLDRLLQQSPDVGDFIHRWYSEAPLPQTTRKGRLYVEAEPQYAAIGFLNLEAEFVQGMELEPGRYNIEVSADGYETKREEIELGTGEDKHLSITLTKVKAHLWVETKPRNAAVSIINFGGEFAQGMELEPGKYEVEISAAGYKTKSEWLKVGAGEDKHISIELTNIDPSKGRIFVDTEPQDAMVRFVSIKSKNDRKPCPYCGAREVYRAIVSHGGWGDWCPHCQKEVRTDQSTTIKFENIETEFSQGMELKPGNYLMEVSADKFETKTVQVEVQAGEDNRIRVILTKITPLLTPKPNGDFSWLLIVVFVFWFILAFALLIGYLRK
jgi:hypothetical protein